MSTTLSLRNTSETKRLIRRDALERLAERICTGEHISDNVEISLLLCDDDYMTQLNYHYRNKRGPTDVLSFEQESPPGQATRLLGDVVISLETANRACQGDRKKMRQEVDLLFCHGLLHLLGYDHANKRQEQEMKCRQAQYLGLPEHDAWPTHSANGAAKRRARR